MIQAAEGVEVSRSPIAGGIDAAATVMLDPAPNGAVSYSVLAYERDYGGSDVIPGEVVALHTVTAGRTLLEPVEGQILGVFSASPVPALLVPFDLAPMHDAGGYSMQLADFTSGAAVAGDVVRLARTEPGNTLDLDVFVARTLRRRGSRRLVGRMNPPSARSFVENASAFPPPGRTKFGPIRLAQARSAACRSVLGPQTDVWGRSRAGRIQAAMPAMNEILAQAGVTLGDVRFHPVGGVLGQQSIGIISGELGQESTSLGALFELTAGLDRPSVPVFVVRQVTENLRCPLGGRSSGIPGPQGVHGTAASGVILALEALRDSEIPLVVMHEVGHFLGLFHATEADGQHFDSFTDTPRCTPVHDLNGNGFVTPSECAGAGADNLMFWASIGTTLSDEQGAVIRSSPLLR